MAYIDSLPRGRAAIAQRGREAHVARHVEDVIDVESERERALPSKAGCKLFKAEFERFAAFARELGLGALPATGHTVAFYILDLLANGASLDEIATAIAAVEHAHEMAQKYLDWMPIAAALEFANEARDL